MTLRCPGCSGEMSQRTFEANYAKPVTLDLCLACAAFWFDGLESLALAPGAVLDLFVLIHENRKSPPNPLGEALSCPRCRARLARTANMQRNTRFAYWRCPADHGHFITFLEFLREKNFVRPLSVAEIEDLKRNVRSVTCSSCGAPVDLAKGSACSYCRAPLSMLDAKQVDAVVASLKRDEAKREEARRSEVDPALHMRLLQDRASVSRDFKLMEDGEHFAYELSAGGNLVDEGISALVALLKGKT
jgi:uncharacterized protein YbaR (Trm112 family)